MKVKQLIEILEMFDNGDDVDIAIVGYNDLGIDVDSIRVANYGLVGKGKKVVKPKRTLCLDISAYPVELVDASDGFVYLPEEDYNSFEEV